MRPNGGKLWSQEPWAKKGTPILLRLVLVSMDAWEYNFHVSHEGTIVSRSALKIVVMALR